MKYDCVRGNSIHESTNDWLSCKFCHIEVHRERSKREDPVYEVARCAGEALRFCEDRFIRECGALNSQETD